MTSYHIKQLICLHKKATWHRENYKKLSGDPSAQSKALDHKWEAERIYSRISSIIRDTTPFPAYTGEERSKCARSNLSMG